MDNEKIKLDLDGRIVSVTKEQYIKAKTKDLKNFGYESLTEKEVGDQLSKVLASDKNLSIIGMFIEKDIVKN